MTTPPPKLRPSQISSQHNVPVIYSHLVPSAGCAASLSRAVLAMPRRNPMLLGRSFGAWPAGRQATPYQWRIEVICQTHFKLELDYYQHICLRRPGPADHGMPTPASGVVSWKFLWGVWFESPPYNLGSITPISAAQLVLAWSMPVWR